MQVFSRYFDTAVIKTRISGKNYFAAVFSYDTNRIESNTSNNVFIVACVFVVVVTLLPNRCLTTIGDSHTNTETNGRDL
jgi:hypothetical protein